MSQAGIVDVEGSHPQIPTSFITNMGTAIPLANVIEILGTAVAAHSIPLQTTGSGNTVTIQVQYASAAASSSGANAGVASFSSTQFTVDANGFVSLNGSVVAETITGNTGGALSPVAGNWNIFGSSVAAGTTPVHTAGSGNTLTVDVQISQAIASTDATKIGLAAFNSTYFTVDANGFVSFNGGLFGETITGNVGGALSPTAGNWNILGTSTAAGTTPVQTSGSVSTLTIQVQKSQAIASTNATNVGLAAFNSTYFSVDANGFVTLVPSSVVGSFTVDAFTAPGTNPVVPNASGVVIVTGGQVAAGTTANVIRTDSLAANTYTIQIQRSQAVASSTIGDNGVSHFNSAFFTVDANGFVSLNGGAVGETITGNVGGALSPTAGNWNILGTSTAAGTTPVQTSGTGSTLTVQVQKSQAIASTNATNVGLAAFSSAQFAVDSNGFVTLNGAAVGETITGNTGGALSPTAGNWNILGTASTTTSGSGSTLTMELTGITQYNVQTGGATGATLNNVAPSATSGVPLISQGAASQPIFGTAVVAGGGTGNTTFTAYSVITAGTTATGAFQNVSGVGTSGQVLTSNGAGALPTWQAASGGSAIVTINGDSGSITGTTVTIKAGTSTQNSGSSVSFSNSGTTSTFSLSNGTNTILGNGAGNATLSGGNNVGIGTGGALTLLTSGGFNSGCGAGILGGLTTGSRNSAFGYQALGAVQTGSYNIGIGQGAGSNYTSSETSNICISAGGTAAESNVIRIGTQGTGNGQQNACYIAGIEGVSVSNKNYVTINTSTGQLGSEASTTLFSVVRQVFTSTGTYTPTSGMVYCDIECVGGGGGGGSALATGSTTVSVGGGGGAGEYSRGIFSAATIGASKSVTIGAAGTAGTAGGGGGTGGTTSVGATIISSIGGTGGNPASGAYVSFDITPGGAGGNGGTGGDFRVQGTPGGWGMVVFGLAGAFGCPGGGYGGSTFFGGGALAVGSINVSSAGNAATGYGGGGGGAANGPSASAANGGAGFKGVVIITEYVIA
jgi:hypothetical protein